MGQELSQGQVAELKGRDVAEAAYERVLGYLSHRPRSAREVARYLSRRDVPDEAIEDVLARLERARLVDDAEFARFWVENRRSFRPKGLWALRAELRQKGVASEVIESVLEGIDEEDEAMSAGTRAVRRFAHLDETTFRHRLLGYLQRRGFAFDVSRRVVDHLWSEVEAQRQVDAG